MVDNCGVVENEETIDLDYLLDNIPDDPNSDFFEDVEPAADVGFGSGFSLSIDDIEQYLLNDDSDHQDVKDQNVVIDEFLLDVLLPDSSPESCSDRPKESCGSESDEQDKDTDKPHENKNNNATAADDGDDPVAKKRKRQIRNRDAAVRSRERKKMYVRDLEMKSKYYEAECKRLGVFLQCCLAENQALRLSLHNSKVVDASMTKQESAVLFLESLLLGSLLGFLGIIYLLILPSQFLSVLEKGLLENVEWGSPAPRKTGSKVSRAELLHSVMMGKRCKASRSRMKLRCCLVQKYSCDFLYQSYGFLLVGYSLLPLLSLPA